MTGFGDLLTYFRRRVFLFVPNLCNAKCAFCYVKPMYAERAVFPRASMRSTARRLGTLAHMGFDDLRITGGEPMLFENLEELAHLSGSLGFRYSLLTNGLNIEVHEKWLEERPPHKLTISLHSTRAREEFFGVDSAPPPEPSYLSRLAGSGCTVAVTAVALPGRVGDLDSIAEYSLDAGVTDVRILVPNDRPRAESYYRELRETVEAIARQLDGRARLRVSKTTSSRCELDTTGYLSMSMTHTDGVSPCCVVSPDTHRLGHDVLESPQTAAEHLRGTMRKARLSLNAPCGAIDFCPLTLSVRAEAA